MLKWAAISEEVKLFFMMFRMQGPEMISVKTLQADEFVVYEKHLANTNEVKGFPSEVV